MAVYSFRLSGPPSTQESEILAQAQSGSGPLFFHVADDRWLQPLAVYATTLVSVVGGGELSARLSTVFVAALNVALLFLCAYRIFDAKLAAYLAPLLLLASPAHIAFGRAGTDALMSVPFVLLWLLAMLRFWSFDSTSSILLAGAALGAGVYGNRAAPLTMGFLLILSVVALISGGRKARSVLAILAAFGAALIPAVAWFALNPGTYPDTFGRWVIHLAHVRQPLEGLGAFLNWNTLGSRVSLYWGFLEPTWLFFENVFLLVMLPLLLLGLGYWRRVLPRHAMILVGGGVIATPLAGCSFGEPRYVADAAPFLPLAILLMSAGVAGLQLRFRTRTYQSSDTAPAG